MDNKDKSVPYVCNHIDAHTIIHKPYRLVYRFLFEIIPFIPRNNKSNYNKSLALDGFNNSITQNIVNTQ